MLHHQAYDTTGFIEVDFENSKNDYVCEYKTFSIPSSQPNGIYVDFKGGRGGSINNQFLDPKSNNVEQEIDLLLATLSDDPTVINSLKKIYRQELLSIATYALHSSTVVNTENQEEPMPDCKGLGWNLFTKDGKIYLSGFTKISGLVQLPPGGYDTTLKYKHNIDSEIYFEYEFNPETPKFSLVKLQTSNSLLATLLMEEQHEITEEEIEHANLEEWFLPAQQNLIKQKSNSHYFLKNAYDLFLTLITQNSDESNALKTALKDLMNVVILLTLEKDEEISPNDTLAYRLAVIAFKRLQISIKQLLTLLYKKNFNKE